MFVDYIACCSTIMHPSIVPPFSIHPLHIHHSSFTYYLVLSCNRVLSRTFTYFHVLSRIFTYFHVLSCTFMYFHVLSRTFTLFIHTLHIHVYTHLHSTPASHTLLLFLFISPFCNRLLHSHQYQTGAKLHCSLHFAVTFGPST
jgi:hypothetical protein